MFQREGFTRDIGLANLDLAEIYVHLGNWTGAAHHAHDAAGAGDEADAGCRVQHRLGSPRVRRFA